MSDQLPPDLSGLDRDAWLTALDRLADDRGYFEPLGPQHSAIFCDDGPVLLVSFETVGSARERPLGLPLGMASALARGWSSLTILADGPTWYRDRRLYGYFDRLVDDSFFEDFDRVIFIGSGMGAYGACAYSVAAPGATVLAFQPRATLDTRHAGWEPRDTDRRRLDFNDRYGYAPDMIEAAERAFLFYDPAETFDAVHVAFFQCENCTPVRLRFSKTEPLAMAVGMGLLPHLLDLAGSEPGLRPRDVFTALRRRHRHHPYTRALVSELAAKGQVFRVAKATRHLVERMSRGRYAGDYDWSSEQLEELGLRLPPPLPRAKPAQSAASEALAEA